MALCSNLMQYYNYLATAGGTSNSSSFGVGGHCNSNTNNNSTINNNYTSNINNLNYKYHTKSATSAFSD